MSFPLRIAVDAPSLQEGEAQQLVRTTQHALDDLNELSAHHLRLNLEHYADKVSRSVANKEAEESGLRIHLSMKDDIATPIVELRPHSMVLDVFYAPSHAPSTASGQSTLANIIAEKLQELYLEEQLSIAHILDSDAGPGYAQQSTTSSSAHTSHHSGAGTDRQIPHNSGISQDVSARLAARRTRALKYASTYHLTLSLFTPTATPTSWAIEEAVQTYLLPLLDSLSISNFTVDTQVQLYATFSPSMRQPEFDSNTGTWVLRLEDLGSFINAAEWPLGPSVGSGPTLHFLLYVPSPEMTPLVISSANSSSTPDITSGTTSWLIPQWGGISILNPPASSSLAPTHLEASNLAAPMLTFTHHLTLLLGVPSRAHTRFPPSSPGQPPIHPLQLQSLTRQHTSSLFFSASRTLGALARLASSLGSIPIPENVALGVKSTMAHLQGVCDALSRGQWTEGLEHARLAEEEAERAFFEKSMVGQVYFPDQHKLAVYLPLLGPVAVPLVMSLGRVVGEWKGR